MPRTSNIIRVGYTIRHNIGLEVFQTILVGIKYELSELLYIHLSQRAFLPCLRHQVWERCGTSLILQVKASKTNAQSSEQSVNDLFHESKEIIHHIFQAEQQS